MVQALQEGSEPFNVQIFRGCVPEPFDVVYGTFGQLVERLHTVLPHEPLHVAIVDILPCGLPDD